MGESDTGTTIPKSMRQKRILDVAAEKPDAPLDEIAYEIPSATTDLVERVLEEFGDPADDTCEVSTAELSVAPAEGTTVDVDSTPDDGTETTPDSDTDEPVDWITVDSRDLPTLEALSAKQRTTLRLIRDHPTDTQAELARRIDVSAPTISNRVNSIDGFEWRDRQAFVAAIFDESTATSDTRSTPGQSATDGGVEREPNSGVNRLAERVTELERQLEALPDDPTRPVFDDPELLHKVVHACMNSTNITEDEELRILKALLATPPTDE